jgi:hypothetical protein
MQEFLKVGDEFEVRFPFTYGQYRLVKDDIITIRDIGQTHYVIYNKYMSVPIGIEKEKFQFLGLTIKE